MSKQLIYSRSTPANSEGRTVLNPRFFNEPVEGATKVFIDGSYPKIARAYEDVGVPVADIADMRALPGKARAKEPTDPAPPATPPAEGSSSNSH
ncbi:hypothetical protein [Shinella sp.]|uniref:hypothetical protein n=1 Tax=Shinella sp. TaxID=1870904 RepID=UPI0029A9C9F4|nr:hypothetical protein [Shinella sp.]MDX3973297.1 hypothetical protein [Shinella sp.]